MLGKKAPEWSEDEISPGCLSTVVEGGRKAGWSWGETRKKSMGFEGGQGLH